MKPIPILFNTTRLPVKIFVMLLTCVVYRDNPIPYIAKIYYYSVLEFRVGNKDR